MYNVSNDDVFRVDDVNDIKDLPSTTTYDDLKVFCPLRVIMFVIAIFIHSIEMKRFFPFSTISVFKQSCFCTTEDALSTPFSNYRQLYPCITEVAKCYYTKYPKIFFK